MSGAQTGIAVRLYRALLRLCYPRSYRARFTEDQAATFADQLAHVRAKRGLRGVLGLWAAVLPDVIGGGIAERTRAMRGVTRTPERRARLSMRDLFQEARLAA